MKFYSSIFSSQVTVGMTPDDLLVWLSGSNTNPATDLTEQEIVSEEQTNANYPIIFPLAGREESLQHITKCFLTSYKERCNKDRNSRPIPICTGIPGLGKTRLMYECAATVLDRTQIAGKWISGIISFGNDGNAYGQVDDFLGIQCSFAWRVLHMFFKAHYSFDEWMRLKSPMNREALTLSMALSTIEHYWRQRTQDNILVYVGIDEYQKLGQEKLNSLLDILCDCSYRGEMSKLSFFCMLAGTDLNLTRIARASHPNTQRTPIRFLTHKESITAIEPYLSKFHNGFVINEAFAQNVFYLGGVPRVLTEFAKKAAELDHYDMTDNYLRDIRMSVLCNLQFPLLSFQDTLKLLAISFTNTPVQKVLDTPFPNSRLAGELTWNQLISNGACLVQDNGCVTVPFHLVAQVLDMQIYQIDELNKYERALLSSLKDLSQNVETSINNSSAWLSWESFGARFYSIRINSFLVLGQEEVSVSSLIRGSKTSKDEFEVAVRLKIAKVIQSTQNFGPEMPHSITPKGSYSSVDWIEGDFVYVVLNGENGPGGDIFFILKRSDELGYILMLDQRKPYSSDITNGDISSITSKIPDIPKCIKGTVKIILGLMSIYSEIKIEPIPKSTFIVSSSESSSFHGSLFDHPGCTLMIDVNSATCTALCQIFGGKVGKRKSLAYQTIDRRKKAKFVGIDDLNSFISQIDGTLDECSIGRVCF